MIIRLETYIIIAINRNSHNYIKKALNLQFGLVRLLIILLVITYENRPQVIKGDLQCGMNFKI